MDVFENRLRTRTYIKLLVGVITKINIKVEKVSREISER